MTHDTNSAAKGTRSLAIVLAWLVVGVPAIWGIYNTGLNAKKLFAPAPVTAGLKTTTAH